MRVCILSDEVITNFNPAPYIKDFDWQMVTMTAPVMDKIRALAEKKEFDVFLNVCEGYEFEDEEDDDIGISCDRSCSGIGSTWSAVYRRRLKLL